MRLGKFQRDRVRRAGLGVDLGKGNIREGIHGKGGVIFDRNRAQAGLCYIIRKEAACDRAIARKLYTFGIQAALQRAGTFYGHPDDLVLQSRGVSAFIDNKSHFVIAAFQSGHLVAPAFAVVNRLRAAVRVHGVAVAINFQIDFGRFCRAGRVGLIRKGDRYVLLTHDKRGGLRVEAGDVPPRTETVCTLDRGNNLALWCIDGDLLLIDGICFGNVVQLAVQAKGSTVRGRNGVECLGTLSKRAGRLISIDAEAERAVFTGHSVGVNGTHNSTLIHHFTGDIRVTDAVSHSVIILDGEGIGDFVIAPTAITAAGAYGPMGRCRNFEVLTCFRKCPHGQDAQYHADCQQKTDEPLFHVIHLLCFDPLGMYSAIEAFRRFYSGSILL